MSVRVSVDVDARGPLFDGRAKVMYDRAVVEWEHHLGSVGADFVRAELHRVLRVETPYYRTKITSVEHPGVTLVTDQDVIYGPWLEGTGSRNKTTRFKGYWTFRRTAQKLRAQAIPILQPYVDRFIEKVNHGA